jgi:hypothetical protein
MKMKIARCNFNVTAFHNTGENTIYCSKRRSNETHTHTHTNTHTHTSVFARREGNRMTKTPTRIQRKLNAV